ncbi:MAG TPA: hypothetical protein VFV72_03100 [Candidatus Limnocylindrales bacterium]|nr:hypothetical protein [Candidatus Limnocylindrales bacterium]
MRRLLVGVGVVVAVLAVGAVLAATLSQPPRQTETGVVIAVDAESLTNVKGFTIRTPDGRTVVFKLGRLENGSQFAPGHLNEHLATAVPVLVTYQDVNGERVVIRLEDAAPAAPSHSPDPGAS